MRRLCVLAAALALALAPAYGQTFFPAPGISLGSPVDTNTALSRKVSAHFQDVVNVLDAPYSMKCDGSDEHAALQLLASNLRLLIGGQEVVFPNRTCASSQEVDFDVVNTRLRGRAKGSTLLMLPSNAGTDFITFGKDIGYGYNNAVDGLVIQRTDSLATFTGSASGTTLTVTSGPSAAILTGMELGGGGVFSAVNNPAGVNITGPAASNPTTCSASTPCTYTLSISQATIASEAMRAGNGPKAGVGLHLYAQGPFTSNNLAINGFFVNVQCEACQKTSFYDLESQQGQAWANQVPGSIGVNIAQYNGVNPSGVSFTDPKIGGVQGWQTSETGLNVSAADGVYTYGGHFGNNTYDVKLAPSANAPILSVLMLSPYFDGTGNVGGRALYVPALTGSGQSVAQVSVVGGVTNTHTVNAFDIEAAGTGPYSFTGIQAQFEEGAFVYAPSVGQISIIGNTLNGVDLAGTGPAINIGGTNQAASATVVGNLFASTSDCLKVSAAQEVLSGNGYGSCTSDIPQDSLPEGLTTPNLNLTGGEEHSIGYLFGSGTIGTNVNAVILYATSANVTDTLPACGASPIDLILERGDTSSYTVTVNAASGNLIGTASSLTFASGAYHHLRCLSGTWFIIG